VKWTKEWPTEPGEYWYYGITNNDDCDLLHFVTAFRHAGNMRIMAGSIVCYCENFEMNKSDTFGYWIKAETPELP